MKSEVLLEFTDEHLTLLVTLKIFDTAYKEDLLTTNILFASFKISGYSINQLHIFNLFV